MKWRSHKYLGWLFGILYNTKLNCWDPGIDQELSWDLAELIIIIITKHEEPPQPQTSPPL